MLFQKRLNNQYQFIATLLAFAVIPISGLATDIYLPSMPSMAEQLHQSENKIQFTLTVFLISYGITQFFAGAVIDSFGRYRISLVCLLLFSVSFWITANTSSIWMIYLMRIVQGILAGFVVVAKRVFFVDVYEGDRRRHYLSIMSIVWSLGPIVAPFLGGYLQAHFGWQSNFLALSVFSLIIFILELIFSGETIINKNPFHVNFLFNEFRTMFKALDFTLGILMCGFCYSIVMFYNLCGPFIIEKRMGYSSVINGYISLFMGLAWMLGGFMGRLMIRQAFFPKLRYANFIQIVMLLLMFSTSYFFENIYSFVIFAFLTHLISGFIFNNYFSFCLGRFPKSAGISGGLTGGLSFVLTSLVSYSVVAMINPVLQSEVALGYFTITIILFIILSVIKVRKAHI